MIVYDPSKGLIKQVLEPEPDIGEEPNPEQSAIQRAGSDVVLALNGVTEKLVEQQQSFVESSLRNEERGIQLITTVASGIERIQLTTVNASTVPASYTFDIERDEEGRIARVHAVPITQK